MSLSPIEKNIIEFARIYSLPFDMEPAFQGVGTILLFNYMYAPSEKLYRYLFVSGILTAIANGSKLLIKSERPNRNTGWEPEHEREVSSIVKLPTSGDIPSGHSAIGVHLGLIALFHSEHRPMDKAIAGYFLMIPASRYVGKMHSLTAVIIGSGMGIVSFYVLNRM